jgi:pimeloyl-ACP methyl ester carboxylesterase
MGDLIIAVAVFSSAVIATTRRNRGTPLIATLAGITLLAFLLQLTRAAYIGFAIGGLIAVAIALTRGAEVRRILVYRATVLLVASVALFAVIGLGPAGSPGNIVSERLGSGLGLGQARTETVNYRIALYRRMLDVVGHEWPWGLGFLHPKDRYFPSLPAGNIRNGDIGLMGAVMTMGVVGLALIYAILIAVGRHVARTRSRRPAWLVVGLFGWLVVVVAGSPTLGTLFSATGIMSTALTLAVCGVDTPSIGERRQAAVLHRSD